MAFWLFKSEPSTWSWAQQWAKRPHAEEWNGVRNYQARNFMRAMQVGDYGFFYHSVDEKQIVGVVQITTPAHPDSTDTTSTWECIDMTAVIPMPKPVTLAAIKQTTALANMALVKSMRLSVQPVTTDEWHLICHMGGLTWPVCGA